MRRRRYWHKKGRFLVEDSIMVELKLIKLKMFILHRGNYCQAYNLPVGLLINFGSKSLEFKRVYNVNHPENKEYKTKILKSPNPKNPNSDK